MTSTVPDLSTDAGLLRLGNAFCDAQALLTAVELDLFTTLHDNPATEAEIRERAALHGRGLRDYLRLLCTLGVLETDGERYRNAPGADRHLVAGQSGYIGGFLLGAKNSLWLVWGKLTQSLRTGEAQAGHDFETLLNRPEIVAQYARMMDGLTEVLGPRILEAFQWPADGVVLDVGGCRGNLAAQLVKAHPGLTAKVFDRPQLEVHFDAYLAEVGVTGKLSFHAGDFFTDSLPKADIAILGHILHDWDATQREQLMRAVHDALPPGGTLLVYDRMLNDELDHLDNLVASINMLLVSEGGGEYTVGEATALAERTGFTGVTTKALDENETLLICHKK